MLLLTKSNSKISSRRQMKLKKFKDGHTGFTNNEYRMVIETSSVNLELKSEDEQDVLIDSFQNFLNSLSIPLQILIRVREVDIDSYLEKIQTEKTMKKKKYIKLQIDNYTNLSKNLSQETKYYKEDLCSYPYKNLDRTKDF